jgi:two-component sensor histidine kinase
MTTSNTYEWCARNIEPEIDNLQGIPMEAVSNWVEQHARGGYIYYPVVDKMDDSDKTKEILESQGIKSVLTVPMMLDGHCLGFVGFDSVVAYKNYTKEDIGLLQLYAQMLVNVLNRQKQEQAIINSLEEKAVLMKEIHHRVKNNLQVISSLMFLQASYTEDATAKRVLKNSENRIKTMALLHEKIYQSNDLGRLNFKNYVESINYKLVDYYQEGLTKTVLKTDVEDISLNLDKSILAGLIINELVTNALQHAFKGRKEGEISVTAKEMGGTISLVIADDGTGISEDLKDKKTTTLGFQLVENLVNQLKGTLEIVKDGGSRFTIRFPKE